MEPSDLEIEVLVRRIESSELDLQPDFQRGEVWSEKKRQRLIDTILRGWHIPPIHVIDLEGTGKEEVLDGQQRLVAIRDFVMGEFRIDGTLPPSDNAILSLHGVTYSELPPDLQRRFNRYAIRQFRLTDYKPEEPAEIFFRLNQPTSLTTAEQRNAFFGRARAQVKELVSLAVSLGVDAARVGFSNSRMSYDDVIARLCLASERQTIRRKITASDLTAVYRSTDGYSDAAVRRVEHSLRDLAAALEHMKGQHRLNKATLFSWLWYLVAARHWNVGSRGPKEIGEFIHLVETVRAYARTGVQDEALASARNVLALLVVYDDRASSRVSDVSSVVIRDLVLWVLTALRIRRGATEGLPAPVERLRELGARSLDQPLAASEFIESFVRENIWGDL